MRKTLAITGLALVLTGCGGGSPPATVAAASQATRSAPAEASDPRRAALADILTCRDRGFLARSPEEQRAALVSIEGVACDASSPGAPNRCAILPSLKVGGADIAWFVIGTPNEDLTPIILPAPPEALRNAMPAGSGALSPGTDLGDTTVECAMRDGALAKGAISGTVLRGGDADSAMRVCAFELAEGMPICTETARGQRAFKLDLQRGDYLVLAIPVDEHDTRVGYSECDAPFVGASRDPRNTDDTPCSHELKVVTVRAGETTTGVDPADLRELGEAGDWPQPPPAE